jgi:2-oxoglutarate dehydrogenase E2 component (dihydrolipoamide succinyltransferase)
MKIEVKIPAVGESITEATIGSWNKKSGEAVKRNEVLLLLETDKASVEVVAEQDGVLNIQVEAGQTLPIGSTVGFLDTEAKATVGAAPAVVATPTTAAPAAGATAHAGSAAIHQDLKSHLSPATQRVVSERGLDAASIEGTGRGGRLTKEDAMKASPSAAPTSSAPTPVAPMVTPSKGGSKQGSVKRVPMTNIRKKIAERLVEAQHTAAILTTFNEIDMTNVIALREKYKDKFKEKYGVSLGMMGFFTKSVCEALKSFPAVNASIEGTDLVYKNFFNIGVAVSTEKGLIVPIIKDADMMTIAEVEMAIRQFALKARDGKITVDDLSGGTFTISNGGVFGSLMSTPILTPPQVGILGMHKVEDRAVVIDKKIEIRSMMYVALSYDHRIIDGKEAVGFLVRIKECIENPERLLLEI